MQMICWVGLDVLTGRFFKVALQLCTHMAINKLIVTPLKSDAINSKLCFCFRFSLVDADVSTELPV